MLFWLPFVFLITGDAIYQEFYSEDLTCSGHPTVKYASNLACAYGGKDSVCTNFVNLTAYITTCPEVVVLPPKWASIQIWASTTTCSGQPDFTISAPPNKCTGYWLGPTLQFDCDSSSIKECFDDAATCDSCPSKPVDASGKCAVGSPIQYFPMASYIFTCPHICKSQPSPIVESGIPSDASRIPSSIVLLGIFVWIFLEICYA